MSRNEDSKMTETREFPTAVIATLTTGIVLADWSQCREAAEFVMGHPIWTHQYPSIADDMRRTILAQHPTMPTDAPDIDKTNWETLRDKIVADLGPTVTIRKGSGLTAMLPTDAIPDHVETILVSGRTR
jgi:hypothetical protein